MRHSQSNKTKMGDVKGIIRDVLMGASHSPQYFNICRDVGQKSARLPSGLPTVISVILLFSNNLVTIVGKLVRTPLPNGRCLGTSLGSMSAL